MIINKISIRWKRNVRWQLFSQMTKFLFCHDKLFLSCEKRCRLSSGTRSAIYS